ncbi:MAG: efflux RND transporter periplasmic adaptor subunit [Candidatus Saganbacteria bacterium]|nr:efflux RND transporter periplasmic adaptor subunit [Candidatus Saganbacteria bacterium]
MDKKRILILVLIAAVLAGTIWFAAGQFNGHQPDASGVIEATEVTISSRVIGSVLELKVDEGFAVATEEEIAIIDPREIEAALNSSRAKHNLAADNYNRSKRLYADRLISEQQYKEARSSFEISRSGVEIAELNLENTIIRAPFSGIILTKAIEAGELAVIGKPIVTMADLNEVSLKVYLPEKEAGKISLGQIAKVTVDSYPGHNFRGEVANISDQAEFTPKSIQTREERTTQVFGIKIKIRNQDRKLKPGMPADAEFEWPEQ